MRFRHYMREKKIFCGEGYFEVDIFPFSDGQKLNTRGKRSKKKKESCPEQKNLNDKNALRFFIQKINTNFNEEDVHITLTYKTKYRPNTIEKAENEVAKYIRRIRYRRNKKGLSPVKYIFVTEYSTGDDGEKPIKIHHHLIMDGALSRDDLEELWRKPRKKGKKKGELIGDVNADRLRPDANGMARLANYISKRKTKKRRWTSSQNLKNPMSRTNDHEYSRRQVEKICKAPVDPDFWERKYPGWKMAPGEFGYKVEYNEFTGWSIYLKFYKLE